MSGKPGCDQIKHIIAVHSAKGGVGKSTVSVNTALALASRGLKVGLLDGDLYGPSLPTMLGNGAWPDAGPLPNTIYPLTAHGLSFLSMGNLVTHETPVIWRGAMVHNMIGQMLERVYWGALDVLVIDLPPGTGDAVMSVAQTLPLDGVLAVSSPRELCLVDTVRGLRAYSELGVPVLGFIENFSGFTCGDCGHVSYPYGSEGVEIIAEELGVPLLGRLPMEPELCEAGDEGEPLVTDQARHPIVENFRQIATDLWTGIEKARKRAQDEVRFQIEPGEGQEVPALTWERGPIEAVWQSGKDEVGIRLRGGEAGFIPVRELRLACPCARCVDEWTGKALLDQNLVAEDIRISRLRAVGNYGIQPVFSDGHRSGIYHFNLVQHLARKA